MNTQAREPSLNSIDIDIGGTFCDLVLTFEGERKIVKSPTTPHDLSICFKNAVEDVAKSGSRVSSSTRRSEGDGCFSLNEPDSFPPSLPSLLDTDVEGRPRSSSHRAFLQRRARMPP